MLEEEWSLEELQHQLDILVDDIQLEPVEGIYY